MKHQCDCRPQRLGNPGIRCSEPAVIFYIPNQAYKDKYDSIARCLKHKLVHFDILQEVSEEEFEVWNVMGS
jgi:hypothetical protein